MALTYGELTVDVYNPSLTLLGTISNGVFNARGVTVYNEIGSGNFTVGIKATNANLLTPGRIAVIKQADGIATSIVIGVIIIQKIRTVIRGGSATALQISGVSFLHELTYRTTGEGNVIAADPDNDDVQQVMAYDGNWSAFIPGGFAGTQSGSYMVTAGESVFEILRRLTEQSGEWFELFTTTIPFRTITWNRDTTIDASPAITCLVPPANNPTLYDGDTTKGIIVSLDEENYQDQLVTRVIVKGAGHGAGRFGLADAEGLVTVPSGYSVNWAVGQITNDTLEGTGQPIIEHVKQFPSIHPEDDTIEADREAAAIALFNAGLKWLQDRAQVNDYYRVSVYAHNALFRAGIDVKITYSEDGYSIDDNFRIQECTVSVGDDGLRTFDLVVSQIILPRRERDKFLAEVVAEQQANTRHTNAGAIGGSTPTTTDHGTLTGLLDDDHTQYLRADGGRQLTGNMLVSSGVTIDGVDISAHALDPDAHHNAASAGNGISVDGSQVISINLASPSGMTVGGSGLALADTIAGAGLTIASKVLAVGAGNGITVNANDVALTLPGSLSISSSNSASGNHTHAIATSTNPGTAAAILATNGSGLLGVEGIRVNVGSLSGSELAIMTGTLGSVSFPAQGNALDFSYAGANYITATNAAGNLVIRTGGTNTRITVLSGGDVLFSGGSGDLVWDTSASELELGDMILRWSNTLITAGDFTLESTAGDLLFDATGAVKLQAATGIQSDHWVDGTTGWAMSYAGDLDCRNIFADTLEVTNFVSDVDIAQAGAITVTKSRAVLSRAFTIPASTGTIYVYDLPGSPDAQVFEVGDYILVRYIDRSSGLTIEDCWGTVSSYTNLADGEQSWTFTKVTGGTTGDIAPAGITVLDYGVSGDGYWHATAVGSNPPYTEIVRLTGAPSTPSNHVTQVKIGNIANGDFGMVAGNPIPTNYNAGVGLWTGVDSSDSNTYKFRLGDASGIRLDWNGSILRFYDNSAIVMRVDTAGVFVDGDLEVASGGNIFAAGQDIVLNDDGLKFEANSTTASPDQSTQVRWETSGSLRGRVWVGTSPQVNLTMVENKGTGATDSETRLYAENSAGSKDAQLTLNAGTGFGNQLALYFDSALSPDFAVYDTYAYFASHVRVEGGIFVGNDENPGVNMIMFNDGNNGNNNLVFGASAEDSSFNTDAGLQIRPLTNPSAGESLFQVLSSGGGVRLRVEHSGEVYTANDLHVDGDLIVTRSATDYTGYLFVPLQQYIDVTNITGLTGSNATGVSVNLPSGVPANAVAVQISLAAFCTAAGAYFSVSPDNGAASERNHLTTWCPVASQWSNNQGVVAINASTSRRVYYQYDANGGTLQNAWVITGYYI